MGKKKKRLQVTHTDPVSGKHLSTILVDDLNNAGWLDPGLSVHLHWNTFISFNSDLYLPTLFPHTYSMHTSGHTYSML